MVQITFDLGKIETEALDEMVTGTAEFADKVGSPIMTTFGEILGAERGRRRLGELSDSQLLLPLDEVDALELGHFENVMLKAHQLFSARGLEFASTFCRLLTIEASSEISRRSRPNLDLH